MKMYEKPMSAACVFKSLPDNDLELSQIPDSKGMEQGSRCSGSLLQINVKPQPTEGVFVNQDKSDHLSLPTLHSGWKNSPGTKHDRGKVVMKHSVKRTRAV